MINLPNECLFKIFDSFQDDSKSLYSCLLVNRHWCRIIVPILWSNIGEKLGNIKLINTCLLALNAEEQALLIPFKIQLPNYPKPLFEYISYNTSVCKFLNGGVINWLIHKGYKEVFGNRWENNSDKLVNAVKCSLIAMFLRTNRKLECLEIYGLIFNNNLLFKNFCRNNTVSSLDLFQNQFDFQEIAEVLFCKEITSLKLDGNNIGIKGVKSLAKELHKNTTLVVLDLCYDNIGIEGGKAFAEALYINTTLTSLNLCHNNIGNEGGKALAKALCKNAALNSLNIRYNNIGIEGGKAFAKALSTNTTLTFLDLSYNDIGVEEGKVLAKEFNQNTALTLDISHYIRTNKLLIIKKKR